VSLGSGWRALRGLRASAVDVLFEVCCTRLAVCWRRVCVFALALVLSCCREPPRPICYPSWLFLVTLPS
jgi:hypothetical protein